jgi:hypothetical protein
MERCQEVIQEEGGPLGEERSLTGGRLVIDEENKEILQWNRNQVLLVPAWP